MRNSAIRFLLVPALGSALLLAACGPSPAQQWAAAQSSLAAGDYPAARAALTQLLAREPRNAAALTALAATLLELDDPDGARAAIARAQAAGADPGVLLRLTAGAALAARQPQAALDGLGHDDTAEAWRIRGEAYLALGKVADALAAFRRGAALGDEPRLLDDYARLRLAGEDLPGAEGLLARLRGRAPQGYRTLMLAGTIAEAHGRWADADKAYANAAARFPLRVEPLVARAQVLGSLNRLADAAAVIEQAARLAPHDREVNLARLRISADRGQWQAVRDALQRNEDQIDPQSAEGALYGEALLRLGFAEQARARLARTVLLQPGNIHARKLLASAQLAGQDPAAAVATLGPVADNLNTGAEEMTLLAQAADAAGDTSADGWRARAAAPAFLRRAPLVTAGQLAMQRHGWAEAVAAFAELAGQGTALGPDGQAYVLAQLAYAQARGGRSGEARLTAAQALALAPASPVALKAAALARIGAGTDLPQAAAQLRQVLAAQPQDIEAVLLLDRLQS